MEQRIPSLDNFINESEFLFEGEVNYKEDKYALVFVGGSIGAAQSTPVFVGRQMGDIIETSNDKDKLVETKKRFNKTLSPGEKSYYKMSYKVIELTSAMRKDVEYLRDMRQKADAIRDVDEK